MGCRATIGAGVGENQMTVSDRAPARAEVVMLAATALFVACLVLSAATTAKLYDIVLLGFTLTVPVGTTIYALTLVAASQINEIRGWRSAMLLVVLGLVLRAGALAFLAFAVSVEPTTGWPGQEAYASVFRAADTILWSGIVAYVVSQLLNIWVFRALHRHGRRGLWLRAIVAGGTAAVVDTVLFVLLAFGASQSTEVLTAVIAGQIVVKLAVIVVATPVLYLGRSIAEGHHAVRAA